jgi:hypothetical protein
MTNQGVGISKNKLVLYLGKQIGVIERTYGIEEKKCAISSLFEFLMARRSESQTLLKTHPKLALTVLQKAIELSPSIPICKEWVAWYYLSKIPSKL